MKEILKRNIKTILFTSLVFLFFAIITYKTPLAGDDWGYALNGMNGNPFATAIEFYYSWSGRFFSELWGFIVAPNKWLWNILNPLFFTIIYYCINYLTNPKKSCLSYIVSFLLILYASDYLRMETYTWIMGTTYVIPLMLCFIYLCIVKKYSVQRMSKKIIFLCLLINFYIGLCMENIAAVMVLINLLLSFYFYFKKEPYLCYVVIGIFSLISFIIMRSSPGSAYRLSENTAWLSMSLLEQIACNIPYFLRYTFYDNKYLILVLNIIMTFSILTHSKSKKWLKIVSLILSFMTTIMLLSNKLVSMEFNVFTYLTLYQTDISCQILNCIIWVFYIIYLFIYFVFEYEEEYRNELLLYLLAAGASNIVMFVSPIFGSRSSLYFYYFAILIVLMVLQQIKMKKSIAFLGIILCSLLCITKGKTILNKYQLVNLVYQDRLSKIEYYLDHPEIKDVWLPRMPIFTVHSADIEPEDTYHMDTFKKYYGLADDCVLHFYWEE